MNVDFMSKTLVIILLGPPGAGKGSQASLIREKMLQREIYLSHVSTGDLLRENIKQGTPLGLESKALIDAGKLVPDPLILQLLFERVSHPDCNQGYILDGFPRTLAQAQGFQQRLGPHSKLVVLNLEISDREILRRITNRVLCEKCQTPYHLLFSPPKQPGICDLCGGKLYQRSDDKEEVLKKRLEVYHEQTKPLIEYFQKLSILHEIQAAAPKGKVSKEIMQILTEQLHLSEIGKGFFS